MPKKLKKKKMTKVKSKKKKKATVLLDCSDSVIQENTFLIDTDSQKQRKSFKNNVETKFDMTDQNGHFIIPQEPSNEETETLKRCVTCKNPIPANEPYFKSEKASSSSYFCKHCNGCPKGHLVSCCRLKQPLEMPHDKCLWCYKVVELENGLSRLCFDCLRPVCFQKCTQPLKLNMMKVVAQPKTTKT